jgi:uncharacterized damage-inducible protein DinB
MVNLNVNDVRRTMVAGKLYDVSPVHGKDSQLGLQLAMLDGGTAEWREELGDLPDEAVFWQPIRSGHSIGAIILHIADVEAFWLHEVAVGHSRSEEEIKRLLSQETQQYKADWPIPPAKPLTWYFEQHDEIRRRTHQYLYSLTDSQETRKRQGRENEYTLRWLLHHVIGHEAYHGGQAVLLSLQWAANSNQQPID